MSSPTAPSTSGTARRAPSCGPCTADGPRPRPSCASSSAPPAPAATCSSTRAHSLAFFSGSAGGTTRRRTSRTRPGGRPSASTTSRRTGRCCLASAHAARGSGDPDAAVDHLERGLRLRGDAVEHDISTFYLFEGTDILSWLARDADADSATVERGLALLHGLVERLDATAPSIGLAPVLVDSQRPRWRGPAASARARRRDRRARRAPSSDGSPRRCPSGVSRASSTPPASTSGSARPPVTPMRVERAAAVFAELGAQPYLERAQPGATSVHVTRAGRRARPLDAVGPPLDPRLLLALAWLAGFTLIDSGIVSLALPTSRPTSTRRSVSWLGCRPASCSRCRRRSWRPDA